MEKLIEVIRTIMKWPKAAKTLSVPRKYVIVMGRSLAYYYSSKNGVVFLNDPIRNQAFDIIKQIKKETRMLLADQEAYLIYSIVKKTEKIDGDIAEVGVYKGGSARLIYEATKKAIHLFDTFEGLPDICEHDDPEQFHKGDYSASLESVKSYLKNYPNISFYKGFFPSTAEPLKNRRFSFIHLDVDIYESTLNCLKFFYSKMSKGGVIISHDYSGSKGVKRAFDEFFEAKPEIIIEPFGTSQCLIVKV